MNDKFQKYKDVLAPPQDKIRLKRKVNETSDTGHLRRSGASAVFCYSCKTFSFASFCGLNVDSLIIIALID